MGDGKKGVWAEWGTRRTHAFVQTERNGTWTPSTSLVPLTHRYTDTDLRTVARRRDT